MTRKLAVLGHAVALAACGGSDPNRGAMARNLVDVYANKGIDPTQTDDEKCLEDMALGRCARTGAVDSPE